MTETIDLVCPSCGRTLRIGAEHAGKQVRCPACQQISAAPAAAPFISSVAVESPAPAAADTARWHLRTPEGAVYGPISWQELLAWVSEGRVAADCELSSAEVGPWQRADTVLPVLRTQPTAVQSTTVQSTTVQSTTVQSNTVQSNTPQPAQASPLAAPAYPVASPFTPSSPAGSVSYPTMPSLPAGVAPHRGALVLIFGLVGIIMGCPLFSALAWILGSRDLREIRAGRMDRSGESVTLIGMVLGMIITILWLVISLIFLSIALIAIATNF